MKPPQAYLIVKLAAAGDVLLTTALARALRLARPHATIGWLTLRYAAPLLDNNPDLDHVVALPSQSPRLWWRALRAWGREHPATTVLLAHRSGWLYASARLSGIGPVVAHEHGVPFHVREHRLQRMAQLLTAAGVETLPGAVRPRLRLSASEMATGEALWAVAGARPRWVIAPGGACNPWSAMPNRVWGRERFLELALRAHAAGVALRWVGGVHDGERTAWICERLPAEARTDFTGRLPLRYSAGVIAGADLVIGNDSLPLVLAQALDRPCLGLYGPTPADRIHASGEPFVQGTVGCGPCYNPRRGRHGRAYVCPRAWCMEQISVEAVWRKAQIYSSRWEHTCAG